MHGIKSQIVINSWQREAWVKSIRPLGVLKLMVELRTMKYFGIRRGISEVQHLDLSQGRRVQAHSVPDDELLLNRRVGFQERTDMWSVADNVQVSFTSPLRSIESGTKKRSLQW